MEELNLSTPEDIQGWPTVGDRLKDWLLENVRKATEGMLQGQRTMVDQMVDKYIDPTEKLRNEAYGTIRAQRADPSEMMGGVGPMPISSVASIPMKIPTVGIRDLIRGMQTRAKHLKDIGRKVSYSDKNDIIQQLSNEVVPFATRTGDEFKGMPMKQHLGVGKETSQYLHRGPELVEAYSPDLPRVPGTRTRALTDEGQQLFDIIRSSKRGHYDDNFDAPVTGFIRYATDIFPKGQKPGILVNAIQSEFNQAKGIPMLPDEDTARQIIMKNVVSDFPDTFRDAIAQRVRSSDVPMDFADALRHILMERGDVPATLFGQRSPEMASALEALSNSGVGSGVKERMNRMFIKAAQGGDPDRLSWLAEREMANMPGSFVPDTALSAISKAVDPYRLPYTSGDSMMRYLMEQIARKPGFKAVLAPEAMEAKGGGSGGSQIAMDSIKGLLKKLKFEPGEAVVPAGFDPTFRDPATWHSWTGRPYFYPGRSFYQYYYPDPSIPQNFEAALRSRYTDADELGAFMRRESAPSDMASILSEIRQIGLNQPQLRSAPMGTFRFPIFYKE